MFGADQDGAWNVAGLLKQSQVIKVFDASV